MTENSNMQTPMEQDTLPQIEEQMKTDCEDTWRQVQQLFQALQEHRGPEKAPSFEEGTDALTKIYQIKIKRLQAEIKTLKNKPLQGVTNDQTLLTEMLKEELTKSITQLKQSLSLSKSQLQLMEEDIEKESVWLDQHTQIQEALQEKLETPQQQPEQIAHEKLLQELKGKEHKLNKYCKSMMKQMAKFVHTHFPPPSPEVADKWKGEQYPEASPNDSIVSYDNYVSLQTILEDLMNRCMETPHEPYLTLSSCHWPPYIELLLRSHIATRHPEGHLRIRLTPFHL